MSRRQDYPGIDLSKPSVQALAFLLRHREFWPDGFVWDYSNCGSCALGLAVELWKLKIRKSFLLSGPSIGQYVDAVRKPLGLGPIEALNVFVNVTEHSRTTVTPEKVADALEKYR